MACTAEFIDLVCEALAPLGEVRARKMMGDYVIYVNEKCIITACDNRAFVKKLDRIAPLMEDAETGCAYKGAPIKVRKRGIFWIFQMRGKRGR